MDPRERLYPGWEQEEKQMMMNKWKPQGGGAKNSRKLLAAMAILAVAFVVLAAVPAALTDSDAARGTDSASGVETVDGSKTAISTEGKGYYVDGDKSKVTITVADNDTSSVLYMKAGSSVLVATAGTTNTITAYVAESVDASGKVVYYPDSKATINATAKVETGVKLSTDSAGTFTFARTMSISLKMEDGATVNYSDANVGYPSGAVPSGTAVTVKKDDSMNATPLSGKVAYSVIFAAPVKSYGSAYEVKVTNSTDDKSSATFVGPFTGSQGDMITVTDAGGSQLVVTGSTNGIATGSIVRTDGSTILNTNGTVPTEILQNGMYMTDYTLVDPVAATDGSGITLVKGTQITDAAGLVAAKGSSDAVVTLKQGFRTQGDLALTVSGEAITMTSDARWTGTMDVQKASGLVLGAANGSMTVTGDTGTVTAVSAAAPESILYGGLVLNEYTKLTVDHDTVVASTGYIDIVKAATGTENLIEVSDDKTLNVLGYITGDGTLKKASGGSGKIATVDGKTSSIGCDCEKALISTTPATGKLTAAEGTEGLADLASIGYRYIEIQDYILIPFDEKGYEFPSDITISMKTADGNGIGISGDAVDKKTMTVTIPAGTTIDTGIDDDTSTPYDIYLGVTHKANSTYWVSQGTDIPVTLNVEGKITGQGDIQASAENATTSSKTDINTKAVVNLSENGVVGPEVEIYVPTITGAKKEMHISGLSDTTRSIVFPVYQKVYVDGGATWSITDGNVIQVLGELEANGKIVVKDGGALVLGNAAMPLAYADIKDSITVEDGGVLIIDNCETTVNGVMQMNGILQPNIGKLDIKGTMTVGSTGVMKTEGTNFDYIVSSKGYALIQGYLDADMIQNKGAVVIDNAGLDVRDDPTGINKTQVNILASDATVTVKSLFIEGWTSGDEWDGLMITDKGYSMGTISKQDRTVGGDGPDANVIKIWSGRQADMTGELVFAESVGSTLKNGTRTYTNVIEMSGSISNSTSTNGAANVPTVNIDVAADRANVPTIAGVAFSTYVLVPSEEALEVAKDVEVEVQAGAVMNVKGYVDMTASQSAGVDYLTDYGTVTVTGKIKVNSKAIQGNGVLNAARYITKEGTPNVTYYVYSDLADAAMDILDASNENTDKTITIFGIITLREDLEVKEPISIRFATANKDTSGLIVSDYGTNDVIMTVDDGAKISSARNQVIVNGTLHILNKETGDKTVKTVCDVTITSEDASDITYTNIYTALATAPSGSTVNVTREITETAGYVDLYAPITVGEGVTLVVGSNVAPLYIEDGVTLYINGTLQTSQDITAETRFGTQAMDVSTDYSKQTSAIVVNGKLLSSGQVKYSNYDATTPTSMYAGAPVAGAYYTTKSWYVISTMAIAQDMYPSITSQDITVHGALVAGDLSFAQGTYDACADIVVPYETVNTPGATSTVATSLSFTSLTVDQFKLKATGSATGTVLNDSASVELKNVNGKSANRTLTVYDSNGKLILTGGAENGTIGTSKGTVYAGTTQSQLTTVSPAKVTVATGTVLQGTYADIDSLTVNGSVDVASTETMYVKDSTIMGSVKVATGSETVTAGSLQFTGTTAIGISAYDVSASKTTTGTTKSVSASVSGPVAYGSESVTIVLNGTTVDSDAMSGLSSKAKTEFYVEGSLWITVYAKSGNTEKINAYEDHDIVNAYFVQWKNEAGTAVTKTDYIGASDFKKVYADVEYRVFNIILKADEGIDDVTITSGSDIIKLKKGTVQEGSVWYNAFTETVKAGTYTLSYTLKNGYIGTAKLMGDGVSGMTFSASGTPSSSSGIDINLQLTGIEKSGYTEFDKEEKDSGLTLTDYLLIVMVVLVVLLAVIVALRLMRS